MKDQGVVANPANSLRLFTEVRAAEQAMWGKPHMREVTRYTAHTTDEPSWYVHDVSLAFVDELQTLCDLVRKRWRVLSWEQERR
jgi:hypothetical protein